MCRIAVTLTGTTPLQYNATPALRRSLIGEVGKSAQAGKGRHNVNVAVVRTVVSPHHLVDVGSGRIDVQTVGNVAHRHCP